MNVEVEMNSADLREVWKRLAEAKQQRFINETRRVEAVVIDHWGLGVSAMQGCKL